MPSFKHSAAPYISVVVGARNDDHGGNMLRRMQAFVNSWIAQSKRFGLESEIVIVEWNPPEQRPRLMDALKWPADSAPCEVRFVEVAPEVHRRFDNSDTIPLHQMIAKNVGIRRARGQFVIAMNLDIVCSAELMQFLAERRLEPGKIYRIDRHDVASEIPAHSSVDELLAFCNSHLLQVFTAEGLSGIAPDGLRNLEPHDVAAPATGLRLGAGWYELESFQGEHYRWIAPEADIVCQKPAGTFRLAMDIETGPSAGADPVTVEIADTAGHLLAAESVQGRCKLLLYVPEHSGSGMLRLRGKGAGIPITRDARMLNLRVFSLRWEHVPEASWPYPHHGTDIRLSLSESRQVKIAVSQGSSPKLESMEVRLGDSAPVVMSALPHRNEVELGPATSAMEIKLTFGAGADPEASADDAGQPASWFLEAIRTGQSTDWSATCVATSPFASFMRHPAYLHTIAAGDFTMLSRDDWFHLRGYPEFTTWPMHIDALFCYAAYHGGLREVVLREPMRIFHIQHLSGAGWTPEGEQARNARVRSKGVSQMPFSELVQWIDVMRRFNAPFIFRGESWGLGDVTLPETSVAARR
ncbi:MAG: hypothetical protein LAP38_12810 [Acidobacteriia bacterium]|nr:hypothetical protein [Terriglobia bacterium]